MTVNEISIIRQAIEEAQSPFGGKVAVKPHKFELTEKQTPSTCGSVSGANWFMLVGFPDDKVSILSAGFRQAQVDLKIFSMGLGTDWMTDTFNGSQFRDASQFPDETPFHIIT